MQLRRLEEARHFPGFSFACRTVDMRPNRRTDPPFAGGLATLTMLGRPILLYWISHNIVLSCLQPSSIRGLVVSWTRLYSTFFCLSSSSIGLQTAFRSILSCCPSIASLVSLVFLLPV